MEERDRLAKIILFCTKIKWSLLCSNLTLVTCRKLDAKDILATIKRPKECQLDSIYYRRNFLPSEHGRRNSVPFQQIFCNRKSKACRRRQRRKVGSDLSVTLHFRVRLVPSLTPQSAHNRARNRATEWCFQKDKHFYRLCSIF